MTVKSFHVLVVTEFHLPTSSMDKEKPKGLEMSLKTALFLINTKNYFNLLLTFMWFRKWAVLSVNTNLPKQSISLLSTSFAVVASIIKCSASGLDHALWDFIDTFTWLQHFKWIVQYFVSFIKKKKKKKETWEMYSWQSLHYCREYGKSAIRVSKRSNKILNCPFHLHFTTVVLRAKLHLDFLD